jgi:hypothetical protein
MFIFQLAKENVSTWHKHQLAPLLLNSGYSGVVNVINIGLQKIEKCQNKGILLCEMADSVVGK